MEQTLPIGIKHLAGYKKLNERKIIQYYVAVNNKIISNHISLIDLNPVK